MVDRGRMGFSKVGGQGERGVLRLVEKLGWILVDISGGRKQQPAIYRKMIKIIVAGVKPHTGYFHQTMFDCFPPVVIDLIPTQVPAPRVFVVPNQRL